MMNDYMAALRDLKTAWNHFENADDEFVEPAIHELRAAETRVAAFRNKMNANIIEILK